MEPENVYIDSLIIHINKLGWSFAVASNNERSKN